MNMSTKKITTLGILCSIAVIVNLLIYFPVVPSVGFLLYDPKDIVIVLGGVIYGPLSSFVLSTITSILEIMFKGGNLIDVLMNVISTCTLACTATYIYKRNPTKKNLILGLILGSLFSCASMLLWNYIVTPMYYHMPRSVVVSLLLPGILPFNLLKNTLNSIFVCILFKPIIVASKRSTVRIVQDRHKFGVILFIIFIVVSLLLVVATYKGLI